MKRLSVIGLAVMALLAAGALGASSASAACKAKPCFTGSFPNTFTTSSGKGTLETVGGTKVECEKDSTEGGEITGEKTDVVKSVIFTGCKSSGFACTTEGAKEGELKTNALESTLGYINAAKKEVGVALKPKGGGNFISFKCTAFVSVTVKGSVIGKITPINTKTKTYKLVFTQEKGKQKPQNLEGEAKDTLETSVNGGAFEESGETDSATLTLAKEATLEA